MDGDKRKEDLRIKNGLVLCDNCDTPASWELSVEMGWIGCSPCMTGETDSFDAGNLIPEESIFNFLKEFNN